MRPFYALGTLMLVIAGICGCGGGNATSEEIAASDSATTQPVNCTNSAAACC
jgi:hypothetical protein